MIKTVTCCHHLHKRGLSLNSDSQEYSQDTKWRELSYYFQQLFRFGQTLTVLCHAYDETTLFHYHKLLIIQVATPFKYTVSYEGGNRPTTQVRIHVYIASKKGTHK